MSATHFHHKKDTMSMMKFVEAFPTVDLIRSFLWRKDYFDELLGIEEAHGNFIQAAEVAEMKGDLLLEAVMLEKAGKYEQAVKSILLHVQSNSLWGMGHRGWPLQKFPEKNKLLEKVKQIAKQNLCHVRQTLDALYCEVSILSDQSHSLCELTEQMTHAQKTGNINFEVLSLRKVLDVHLHSDARKFQHDQGRNLLKRDDNSKMLLENSVSSTTMVFLWNAWTDKLLSSVDSFSKLEKRREREQDKVYIEFGFEYFGIRMNRNNRFCTVFNNEAFRLEGRRAVLMQRRGNCAQISIQNFSVHAKEFLLMEIFSVGMKVVKKLEEIYISCTNQHCTLTGEGTLILQIYQVSKALEDRELAKFGQATSLIGIQNLEKRFFEIFFPLKAQHENVKEFISLRENPTSSLILKDITVNIISKMHNHITLGQIGRLQVLLSFLPKDLMTEYGKKIIESLHDKDYWNNVLLWLHMEMFTGTNLEDIRLSLIKSFETAVTSTFKNWGNQIDYISPHVFLFLLEKLFFFSSLCEYLSEGLFLPRSFFLQFMTGEQGNYSCAWLLHSQCLPRCHGRIEKFYVPIYDIVQQLLVTSKSETFAWIKTSQIDIKTYFPEMALRLISMLCLIGVNSPDLYQYAIQVLSTIFRDQQITKNLLPKFKGKLLQIFQKYNPNRDNFFFHFSRIMRDIDNPLVMIDLVTRPELDGSHEDFIVLRQESIVSREILLQTVFQDEGTIFVLNERGRDMKSKEYLIHGEKNILPSDSDSFITNTEHISESVKAGENVSDNAECLSDKPEKGDASCILILDDYKIDQRNKGDSLGIEASSRDDNIHFSLLENTIPSYKFEVNGQYVLWFVQWRMKRWLSCARRSLGETLSMKDKYIREACRVFQGNKNPFYTEIFISKVCPLKAEVDELLDLIETTIPKVEQGKVCPDEESDVLEEIHDIHEELLHLSELLRPRHEKHGECDNEWLENDVICHTSTKLQESKHRLDRFKSVFEDHTQIVTECSQATESKNNQKKKNKPKGNKKGGKKRK